MAWFGVATTRFGDAQSYIRAASELVETGRYPKRTEPYYFRAPGYPAFLAAATFGHPRSVVAGKAVNAVLGALGILVLAALSARIFRSRRIALATGASGALHPGLVMLSTDVQSEPLFVLLLLCSGYLLLAAAERPSSNLAIAAGAGLALAALTRPSALALAPLVAAPLFDRRWPWRVRGQVAASAVLGLLLTLLPWTLRNALVFRELVPVNDAAGSAFYQGNSDWMIRFYEVESLPEYRTWLGAAFSELERETRRVDEASGGSPAALSRHFVRKTFDERRSDPGGWARLLGRKAWDWLRPYPSPLFWPSWVLWVVGSVNVFVAVFAVRGFARAPGGVRAFALSYLALTMLVHVLFIVVWRYRIASWDPVLLLFAAPGALPPSERWPAAPVWLGVAYGRGSAFGGRLAPRR